jgi:predicted ABC-type ATPase
MVPDLFIIAGPNGAGKSLFSSTLVQIDFEIFDGDRYISQLKQKYPETGSDVLQEHVNEHYFKEAKEKAIKAKKSFAFETNFSSTDPTKSLREFKEAGYKTHLIFIGMNTIADCIQRVAIRVKKGGHKVPEESIIFNFEQGYANLYQYFKEFDTITLFTNTIASNDLYKLPGKILSLNNGNIKFYEQQFPNWIKTFIERVKL